MHTHAHTTCLFRTHSLFLAASGRCVIYISLSLRLWSAQLCACMLATHVFVCVFFFLFLLMHQVVILWHFLPCTQQSFKPCGSPLLEVFSLPKSISWVWQVCRVDKFLLCGYLDGEFQMLRFRTLVRNPDMRKSVIKMKWHSCTVLSQIVHHELEQSDSLLIFPMQGLVLATVWVLFLIYRSDSTIEALLPKWGLSHGVLA